VYFTGMRPRHLYVHVPFCARRCSYCDFAIAVRRRVPVEEYLGALERELLLRVDAPLELETLYLGGGTPSLLGALGIERLFALIHRFASLSDDAEITIEANPDDVTEESAGAWRRGGANRISLGVQSFEPRVLSWMHRTHESWQVPVAVERLRAAGFENISLDLIFALPEALRRNWDRDLRGAIALAPSHLSLYGLTVEPATPLARWVERGAATEAPEESYEHEFLRAHALLEDAGFVHYEVSNFARPGRHSRHNSSYWSGVPYLGIGPAAHSYDGAERRWNVKPYAEWVRRLSSGSSPGEEGETLSRDNLAAERVYLGLRTLDGLETDARRHPSVQRWVAAGWARHVNGRVVLTPHGWLRLDTLAADLTEPASRSYI
jgi:oxygen-independent coproporphyrinogen III oxidase